MPPELPEPPPSNEPEKSRRWARRQFIELTALTVGGLVLSQNVDNLRRWGGRLEQFLASLTGPPAPEIPGDAEKYAAFLAAIGLRSIPVKTILAPHYKIRGSVRNSLPPTFLWNHIVPTLRVADEISRELGERIRIYSAYRSKAYNAACPGAVKFSYHLQNRALDIAFSSKPAAVAAVARKLRDAGRFRGGIGLYSNFVHIDTRGHNADWG